METVITDDELACSDNDVFTWKGKPFACGADIHNSGHRMEVEGVVITPDITLDVRTSLFGTGPQPQTHDEISFRGGVMHIEGRSMAQDRLTILLHCAGYLNKGN